jgi:predicted lipoprotein with Yx(FWY)xxD motif/mono/diheme cytochrome c family protein
MAITNGASTRIGTVLGAVATLLLVTSISLAQNANSPNLDVAYLFGYGEYLIDSSGQTLYAFTEDSDGTSACYDQCAENWPPVIVEGSAPSAAALATGELGTTEREDGSLQLTYNGMPLYTFAQDETIGDVNGEGANDVWFLVSASGELIRGSSQEAASSTASGGAPSEEASMEEAMAGSNLSGAEAELFSLGEEVYTTTASPSCATCHGDQGEGGAGMALAGSDKLDSLELIFGQIINGGHTMPAFGSQLSDRQVAAVATYIRNAWGNDFGAVTPDQASEAR